jgi:hypothetical protein
MPVSSLDPKADDSAGSGASSNPKIEEHIRKIQAASALLKKAPGDLSRAEELCRETRLSWFFVYDEYLLNGRASIPIEQWDRLRDTFQQAVRTFEETGDARIDVVDLVRRNSYYENVKFRQDNVDLLFKEGDAAVHKKLHRCLFATAG